MANVVAGLIEVERRVRADGFETERVPGWETRGKGLLVPRGKVNHWTAGPRSGDAPSLRVVTFGRAGLRNALANTYSSRKPKLYLIAARTAWHAGRGSWRGVTGNSSVLGHEPECSGPGDWSQAHIELMLSLDRAQLEVFGYGLSMVCDHFEWAKPQGRKPDRVDIGGPPWRARLSGMPDQQEDDETMREGEQSERVEELQHAANLCLYLTGGNYDGGGNPHDRDGKHLNVDGHLGPKTIDALSHCVGRLEIRLERRSFYVDVRNPSPVLVAYICAENVRMLAANKAA